MNFSKEFIGYIYEDKKGNIWTTTEHSRSSGWALSCYEKDHLMNEKATAKEIMSQKNMLFGISEDKEANILVGTLQRIYLLFQCQLII